EGGPRGAATNGRQGAGVGAEKDLSTVPGLKEEARGIGRRASGYKPKNKSAARMTRSAGCFCFCMRWESVAFGIGSLLVMPNRVSRQSRGPADGEGRWQARK